MSCSVSEKGGKEESSASSAETNGKAFTDSDLLLGHRSSHLFLFSSPVPCVFSGLSMEAVVV